MAWGAQLGTRNLCKHQPVDLFGLMHEIHEKRAEFARQQRRCFKMDPFYY